MKVLRRLALLWSAGLILAAPAAADISPNNYAIWPTNNQPAKAWILVIHGGAWQGGASMAQGELGTAYWFADHGYGAYVVDYRSAPTMSNTFADVVSAYDYVKSTEKQVYGNNQPPICAWGESAGGHLALMLATVRSLNCVISQAGPTDLVKFPNETADGASAYNAWRTLVVPAVGSSQTSRLRQWSPDNFCPIKTRILMGASAGDQVVPQQQMADLQAKCTGAQSVVLDGNPNDGTMTAFTHADVTQAAMGYWSYRELSFLPQ